MTVTTIASLYRENKTLFILVAVGIFLIELEIFAIALIKSGKKSWLEIKDQRGNIIHIAEGRNLSSFNKYYFEKTFGPLDQYQVNLISNDEPFPFRAWFVAAIGIPVGAVLLFAFIVKAFASLFYGYNTANSSIDRPEESSPKNRFENIFASISRLNIFTIGFLILLAVLTYWILPNFIIHIGRIGLDSIIQFKWFFLAFAVVILGIALWIIYLRYLLAKKTIDSQTEIEKFRLQLELSDSGRLQLDHSKQSLEPKSLMTNDGSSSGTGGEKKHHDGSLSNL